MCTNVPCAKDMLSFLRWCPEQKNTTKSKTEHTIKIESTTLKNPKKNSREGAAYRGRRNLVAGR
jgi:hypothetical protein